LIGRSLQIVKAQFQPFEFVNTLLANKLRHEQVGGGWRSWNNSSSFVMFDTGCSSD
jgi:hypothetical protein